jgi:hypothetical protein
MKSQIRKLVELTIDYDGCWQIYQLIGALTRKRSYIYHHAVLHRTIHRIVRDVFPDLVVRNGHFKGLRYDSTSTVCSTLLPKLLGSYEHELSPVFAEVFTRSYSDIIDIGCAEGFYAVGLALRFPDTIVHAFDTRQKSRALCSSMASLNGVADRVRIGGLLTGDQLRQMTFKGRALILCDCEGYERRLFTRDTAIALRDHDLIIEIHDLIDLETSSSLREAFATTHDITVIESVDDVKKVRTYDYEEVARFSKMERLCIFAENRGATMEWFFLTPKADRQRRDAN